MDVRNGVSLIIPPLLLWFQALLKFKDGADKDRMNINLPGENGATALHIAAIRDNGDCARILVSQCVRMRE